MRDWSFFIHTQQQQQQRNKPNDIVIFFCGGLSKTRQLRQKLKRLFSFVHALIPSAFIHLDVLVFMRVSTMSAPSTNPSPQNTVVCVLKCVNGITVQYICIFFCTFQFSSDQFKPLTEWVVEGTRRTIQQRSSSMFVFFFGGGG